MFAKVSSLTSIESITSVSVPLPGLMFAKVHADFSRDWSLISFSPVAGINVRESDARLDRLFLALMFQSRCRD